MMSETNGPTVDRAFDPFVITRPDPVLMLYYVLVSLLAGPAFVFVLAPLYCKYLTLRYRFDDKGISMSYGLIFKRETLLTYRRIQDIHLTHNIVQRWLGLATVSVQTASGSAGAEIAIDGILEFDALRDFLYQRMRGARGLDQEELAKAAQSSVQGALAGDGDSTLSTEADEATALLREIRDALVTLASRGEAQS
jgi:putative membrane protein